MTDFEFDLLVKLLGREPTLTELGMTSVMWSEHCGYKYSRPVLKYFKKYKEAMEGEGLENAGIIPIGDGLGVVMKVESHNHPSAVAPYQGAATGVGGIIRDIFTMGARPIAALNSLRFGPIRDGEGEADTVAFSRRVFEGVVAGIGGYGNCVGVPTVAGEVMFHPRYAGNPLVNAMCVGIVRLDEVTTAGAAGIGAPVIYLGSATGKDGIHGATFASDVFGENDEDKRPNVQIGDPFAEKVLIEATLEALKTGAIQSIQDMGAAGLTCSTIEMSAKGGVGMEINLDLVPMREDDMTAYELMLSESQERMLAVAYPGREQEVIDVFRKWGTHAVVIGHVTDDGVVTVRRHGVVEAYPPAKVLADECPTYQSVIEEPESYRQSASWSAATLPDTDLVESIAKLMASPNLASKRWVYQQYDQQVQTQTALLPGNGDAAVLAPRGTKKGLSVKIDGNGLWTKQDPYIGGLLAVCEACRNVACTGAIPVGLTDGLNFGSPQQPHVYWQFDRAVKGIADAAEALQAPVVSGNVSFYNESHLGEILPTPMIGALGLIERAEDRIGSSLPAGEEQVLAMIWAPVDLGAGDGLGASQYLYEIFGQEAGRPTHPNLEGERMLHHFVAHATSRGWIAAAHDVSEGGFLTALVEMSMQNGVGLDISLDRGALLQAQSLAGRAFGEIPGVIIMAVPRQNLRDLEGIVPSGLHLDEFGNTVPGVSTVSVRHHGSQIAEVDVLDMRRISEESIPRAMAH